MKTILVDAMNTFVNKDEGIFKEMYDLLKTYDNPKIILSGFTDEQMDKFALNDMPYEVFTLKHDPEKSDPNYFEILLAKYSLTANDVVYFDHDIDAIKSAKSIGIKSYHYDHEKRDLEALKKFIDSNL